MKYFWIILVSVVFCLWEVGESKEIRQLNRSVRGLLMGDAYTAIADDEYTLFYNPAALGRHNGLSIHFLNPDVSVTNVLGEMDRFQNFPTDDPTAIAERILGLPLHLRFGATPGVKMGSFGFNLMASSTTDLVLRNAIHPALDMDYRLDRGFVMGYAYTIGGGSRKPKRHRATSSAASSAGKKTSIGVGFKSMNRQGIFNSFDLFGLELLNKISTSDGDIYSIRKALGYSYGQGYGVDLGIEHSITTSLSQLNLALAIMDVGDTRFTRTAGDSEIPRQEMSVNLGASWSQNFLLLDYTLSVDLAPLNQDIAFGRKLHVGMELGLPLVSGMFGWNGGYISYGLGVNIWLVKLYAGFYGVELGSNFRQEEGKRGILYLSILDFSFDP